jgi:hypothetical protein
MSDERLRTTLSVPLTSALKTLASSFSMSSELSHENPVAEVLKPLTEFVTQSQQLVNKCTKPDQKGAKPVTHPVSPPFGRAPTLSPHPILPTRAVSSYTISHHVLAFASGACYSAEFKKIGLATLIGFLTMGLIGFFIKLIFIPINQIFLA